VRRFSGVEACAITNKRASIPKKLGMMLASLKKLLEKPIFSLLTR